MARFSNPFVQYFNGSAQVLPGNKLFFFEPGTTTPKDTFSDSGLTTANTNPVIANGDGRIPDIFLSGIYKVQLKDKFDVIIATADPVGETDGGQWTSWLNDNIYSVPDIVKGSDDEHYRSISNSNQGNDPLSSPSQWEELELGRKWNPNVTYSSTDSAYGSDGNLYKSLVSSNLNNDPISSSEWGAAINIDISGVRNHLTGMSTSNNATDSDHDIDIAAGICSDSGNDVMMNLTSSLTKQIDATWVEGSGAGGMAESLTVAADTTYHIFAISKPSGIVDVGFDTSVSAANLLVGVNVVAAGYDKYRRIASIITDSSSNIIAYIQNEDSFILDEPIRDASDTAPSGGAGQVRSVSVPNGILIESINNFALVSNGFTTDMLISSTLQTLVAASSSNADIRSFAASGLNYINQRVNVITNSAQVRYYLSSGGSGIEVNINTIGWIDTRGK